MSGITRRTSSNMTLIVSTVEYWAAIWLSMCSDLSRISPILSVLMMEWCLVKSLCSSWTWSFKFCISVCRDYKHTDMHIYRATCKNFPSKWWVYRCLWSAAEHEKLAAHYTSWKWSPGGIYAAVFHCFTLWAPRVLLRISVSQCIQIQVIYKVNIKR